MKRVLLPLATAVVMATGASSAVAEGETVAAYGTGQVPVTPTDRTSETAIRAAIQDAQNRAIPLAIENAKVNAKVIADAAGLNLASILSVEATANPFFFGFGGVVSYGGGPIFGQFNGNFCGITTRAITRRTRVNGQVRVRVVRRVRERRCVVPQAVQNTLEVTFRAALKV